MNENDRLDSGKFRTHRRARVLFADGSLPGSDSHATQARDQSARDGGDRSPLAVGSHFMASPDGEKIQLTQVTADFVHWIAPTTGSTGRMMRRYFLDFYSPT